MEVEVAEFLLENKDQIIDDLKKKKIYFVIDYWQDEYTSAVTKEVKEYLSGYFSDYGKLTEIVDQDFIIKVYGKDFFTDV